MTSKLLNNREQKSKREARNGVVLIEIIIQKEVRSQKIPFQAAELTRGESMEGGKCPPKDLKEDSNYFLSVKTVRKRRRLTCGQKEEGSTKRKKANSTRRSHADSGEPQGSPRRVNRGILRLRENRQGIRDISEERKKQPWNPIARES